MERATLDYYEAIFFEVVKRNPEKFVGLIRPFIDSRSNQRWITTEELCEAIGTSTSSWLKSDVRNHPVVVAARRVDTKSMGRKEKTMRTEKRLKNTVPFKKFLAWYLKWLGIVSGCIVAILTIDLMVLLYVGEANHQHTNKVDLIRNDKYVEVDFQDTWKTKKASAGTLTKKKIFE